MNDQYRCWNDELRPALAQNGIRVLGIEDLDAEASAFVEQYCERELDLLVTPVTVDPSHPFPRVINKALCVGFLLRRRRRSALTYTGVVTVPRALPRLIRLPSRETVQILHFSRRPGYTHHASRECITATDIISAAAFRVTRNSNLYWQEEESRSLLGFDQRPELTTAAKETRFAWKSKPMPIPKSSSACAGDCELETWQVFPVRLDR